MFNKYRMENIHKHLQKYTFIGIKTVRRLMFTTT